MESTNYYKNVVVKYRKYIKSRLTTYRTAEVLLSLLTLGLVACQYFEFAINSLWNLVSILYLCGVLFTINAQYQDTCKAKGWARTSRVFAAIIYLATVTVLTLIILDSCMVIDLATLLK